MNDFQEFVAIQAETAVRHIGTSYAYDSRDKAHLSLRENAEAITQRYHRTKPWRAAADDTNGSHGAC